MNEEPVSEEPDTGERTLAWFHCFAGIAGDMALGSLVDAGADADEVRALVARLAIGGWELRFEDALRGGIACTRALVRGEDGVARSHGAITALIAEATLPPRVAARARRVFDVLAAAEATLHRTPVDDVHFHELGGHDAVVDVVGTAAALEVLGVDEVAASPVATGTGTVRSAHGVLPNPAPATVRLLEGIPAYGRPVDLELTTPTGAALLAGLCSSFGPLPDMEVTSSGFGGGAGQLADLPNCTQVVLGRRLAPRAVGPGQPAVVLETNLDDVTGEQLGLAVAATLEAGALDAWVSPVTMKKGRPGHVLHVLADAARLGELRRVVQRVTGTMGTRATVVQRWPVERALDQVLVEGMTVRMKVSAGRAKPEFDDVAAVAAKTGTPVPEVASRAEEAWRASRDVLARPARPGREGPAPA